MDALDKVIDKLEATQDAHLLGWLADALGEIRTEIEDFERRLRRLEGRDSDEE